MPIENLYNEDEAWEEAEKIHDQVDEKVKMKKAKNYTEAEKQVENDIELDKFHERWALIEADPILNNRKNNVIEFINSYSKIGHLENYSYLDKALDLLDKDFPVDLSKVSTTNQIKSIRDLYKKESLIGDTILTMCFNIKQWEGKDNKAKLDIINSLEDRLKQNSITEQLLAGKKTSSKVLERLKMSPRYPQTIKEGLKILEIRDISVKEYQSLLNKITDPNEKSDLINELKNINQYSPENKKLELERIIFSHPNLAELIETKPIQDITKTMEAIQDKIKQILGDNPTPEKITELLTKHPDIINEISDLLKNPNVQKQFKEQMENLLKSTQDKSKENAPAWLEKAKETAKIGGWALGAGFGIFSIIIFILLFLGLNKATGLDLGGEGGKGKK